MKISKKTEVPFYSFLGLVACLANNLYLSNKVPEEQQLSEIEKERKVMGQKVDECSENGYISLENKCLNIVQQYDNLGEEAAALRNTPAYISAQEKHNYSDLPLYVAVLFTLTGFLEVRSSAKRNREEKEAQGEEQ